MFPTALMHLLSGKPLFSTPDRVYGWEDVALATIRRRDWAKLVEEARFGLGCQAQLQRAGGARPEQELAGGGALVPARPPARRGKRHAGLA